MFLLRWMVGCPRRRPTSSFVCPLGKRFERTARVERKMFSIFARPSLVKCGGRKWNRADETH